MATKDSLMYELRQLKDQMRIISPKLDLYKRLAKRSSEIGVELEELKKK